MKLFRLTPIFVLCVVFQSTLSSSTHATVPPPESYLLLPVSGADGEFERIQEGDETVLRCRKGPDGFARHMYFRLPDEARRKSGSAYLEVTYRDVGVGRITVEYDAEEPGDPYRRTSNGFDAFLGDTGRTRTAVFRFTNPGFRQRENMHTDLRLCSPSRDVGLNVLRAVLSYEPTPRYLEHEAKPWLQPYRGPTRNDIDATTLHHKVLTGYQGWFRCPGDPADQGWRHWSRDQTRIDPATVSVEMWPDLSEWKADETYPAPGFHDAAGAPGRLFSSVDVRTVERHFDWMRTYGIDGVFAQRFLVNVGDPSFDRVLGLVRDNANRTGRTFAVCYDLSGMPERRIFDRLDADWRDLTDEWKLTKDGRYLHDHGKPVVFLWGFYPDRFSAETANRLLDIFQKGGPAEATVVGGCPWYWRTEKNEEWVAVFRRFDVLSPWNVGNITRVEGRKEATTSTWKGDIDATKAAGNRFLPVIYPGFGWVNLKGPQASSNTISRQNGAFFWRQFVKAADLGAEMAYVAMFDEVDEGTAIFKVTNDPPANGRFQTPEGLPTDWYLRLTGEGTKLLRGERERAMPVEK